MRNPSIQEHDQKPVENPKIQGGRCFTELCLQLGLAPHNHTKASQFEFSMERMCRNKGDHGETSEAADAMRNLTGRNNSNSTVALLATPSRRYRSSGRSNE